MMDRKQQWPTGDAGVGTGAGVRSPASATQPFGINPISERNTPQSQPQITRKKVPVRKPVGGTNATAPMPQRAQSNAPLTTGQYSIPRPNNLNANLPTVSTVSPPPAQPQIQATQDLPAGWSSAYDPGGRVYYLNHITKQTSWTSPIQTLSTLPSGWEERTNPDGRIYYFNIHTQGSSWERPCGDAERRRSSVISPGTSIRNGSFSTMSSGPTSSNPSFPRDPFSPSTSGATSPNASLHDPFSPLTSGPTSPTSSVPGDSGLISPGVEWEAPQYSKSSRRRSQFSLSSISSASSSAMSKMHLNSLPTPHLPANTPRSISKSVDLGMKSGRIAADYGKKGVKFATKGVKNNRKAIGIGIKGFKVVNSIVKASTGVSLGAEFLPDLDLLPDGIFDGGDAGGDVGGGYLGGVDVDVGVDDIGEGISTDGVDTSGFDASGFDTSVDGVDVDSASVQSVQVDTGIYGTGVDTIEVDTVEVDTVEVDTVEVESVEVNTFQVETVEVDVFEVDTVGVDTVGVDTVGVDGVDVGTVEVDTVFVNTFGTDMVEVNTVEVNTIGVDIIEENTVEVDTIDVETGQTDIVQVGTVGFDNIGTYDADQYILSSDTIVQENYGYEQVDVGYVEEVDVSVWYVPGTDYDDEQRRPGQQNPHQQAPHQQTPHQQTPHQHDPPHQKPFVKHPQAIIPHSKPTPQPHSATNPLVIPTQVDIPALTIRPRRKPISNATVHEISPPQVPVAETKSVAQNESQSLEAKSSINTEDPKTIANVKANETRPEVHGIPVSSPQDINSFQRTSGDSNPSRSNKDEDDTACVDLSSFSGDLFWIRDSDSSAGNIGTNKDLTEKEVAFGAPAVDKNAQSAIQGVVKIHAHTSPSTIVVGSQQQRLPSSDTEILNQNTINVPAAGLMGTNNDGPLGTY